jgi:hypothetical protein
MSIFLTIFITIAVMGNLLAMAYRVHLLQKSLLDLYKNQTENLEYLHSLNDRVNRLCLSTAIIKLDTSIPVQKTVIDIFASEPSLKPSNIHETLLKHLLEEYTALKETLILQINSLTEGSEIERNQNILNEIDNIMTLMGTVSMDSSHTYIEQIFNEVMNSVRKIKSY